MTQPFTLSDGTLTLVLALPDCGMPEILGFGAGIEPVSLTPARSRRVNGMDVPPPGAVLLPTGGMGVFGWPAIAGHRDGRDFVLEFAGWEADAQGSGAVLKAADARTGLAIAVHLSIVSGALACRVALTNRGAGVFTLDRCMAGSMVFSEGPVTLTHFAGTWGREFQMRRDPLLVRHWLSESRRGRTSHDRSPSLILASPDNALAVHLGWSGNHVMGVETLEDGRRLVHAGELFEPGEMRLETGASYESPVAYFALSPAALRARLRAEMTWPGGSARARPVTLNTWEGNYFDHRLPALMAQADAAAALGIERFVLDDGWFGQRDDDTRALGDWEVDPRKYPHGLKPLADHVHSLGMEFGLWFEPEMINPDSDLYRAHPDWAMHVPGRDRPLSRHQLVLDLTRPEVSDHIFASMDKVLRETGVDCIKWDMNRDVARPAHTSWTSR